jgi:hypothetical protein
MVQDEPRRTTLTRLHVEGLWWGEILIDDEKKSTFRKVEEKCLTQLIADCMKINSHLETLREVKNPNYDTIVIITAPTYKNRIEEMRRRGYDNIASRYEGLMNKW